MKHFRVKKIITMKNQVMYYLGDGFWFGRISKEHAESGLQSGKYVLWETIDKSESLPDDYKIVSLDSLMMFNTTIH